MPDALHPITASNEAGQTASGSENLGGLLYVICVVLEATQMSSNAASVRAKNCENMARDVERLNGWLAALPRRKLPDVVLKWTAKYTLKWHAGYPRRGIPGHWAKEKVGMEQVIKNQTAVRAFQIDEQQQQVTRNFLEGQVNLTQQQISISNGGSNSEVNSVTSNFKITGTLIQVFKQISQQIMKRR